MRSKMRVSHFLSLAAFTLVLGIFAVQAGMSENLTRRGYAVVEKTQVDGVFDGCDPGKPIPLMNSLLFVCEEYGHSYSYMPEVLIFKHTETGAIKVIIDDKEYDGLLEKRLK